LAGDASEKAGHSIPRSFRKVDLCHFDELPERRARGFDPFKRGQPSLFVIKQNSQLYAYRDLCPHYGDTPLPWKKDEYLDKAGDVIVCAGHGARFDIVSGSCISGPCLGQSLTPVRIEVGKDGLVTAEIET
jgi:nitrite reductase/ring-hydroxylating ferredoxin subunit